MPTTPAITAFEEAIDNIQVRRGLLLFTDAATYNSVDLAVAPETLILQTAGVIKDMNLTSDEVEFGPDTMGRTFTQGFDVDLSWTLMQTSPTELQNLPALVKPSGKGLYVMAVDKPFPIADLSGTGITYADVDNANVNKLEFLNVSIGGSLDIDFNREESGVQQTVDGFIEIDELSKLYDSPILFS